MTDARQLQLLHDMPISVAEFAVAMLVALSRGPRVKNATRHILYLGTRAAMYVHLISTGPASGQCLHFI